MSTITTAAVFSWVHMPAVALHAAVEHIRDISRHPLSDSRNAFAFGRKMPQSTPLGQGAFPLESVCAKPYERMAHFACFVVGSVGRVERGVLTVRFTYRGDVIRIFGAGYWRKGKRVYEQEHKVHERTTRKTESRS